MVTPMADARAPRRGSFLETWRMFSTGSSRIWLLTSIVLVGMAMPLMFQGHGKAVHFAPYALMTAVAFAFATWQFEGEISDRLAFMMLVPQPVDTRRLVLVPLCALGLAAAAPWRRSGGCPRPPRRRSSASRGGQ